MKKTYFFLIYLILISFLIILFVPDFFNKKKKILIIDSSDNEKKELSSLMSQYSFFYYDIENKNQEYDKIDLIQDLEEIKQKYKKGDIDGVLSTQDYIGNIFASLLAETFNLPGPSVKSVLTCQHKYYCRLAQKKLVPEATPKFGLINPYNIDKSISGLPFKFPFFVKPVKSCFSFGASRINSEEELKKNILNLLPAKAFLKPLEKIIKKYTDYKLSADFLLAEEIIEGKQVTLEGFIKNGKIEILGIVDSIMYPKTISFEHFEYPTSLSIDVQNRIIEITNKIIKGIEFNNSFFNIEFMFNPKTDKINIIEINPRSSAQFADFYEKVDGINSYQIMIPLATNSELPEIIKKKGKYNIAASFALRIFKNGIVKKSPSEEEISEVLKKYPDARIQIHVKEGQKLSDELQDGKSYLYAIINLGGNDKKDLLKRFETCKKILTFEIDYGY